jgi:hypothetical protein
MKTLINVVSEWMPRLKLIRDSYVPKDYTLLVNPPDIPEGLARVYVKDNPELKKWYIMAFSGKQSKPTLNYYYTTQQSRDDAVKRFYDIIRNWIKRKKDAMTARKSYQHQFKVGDILYAIWGYDQTNVDYFQIIKVSGKVIWYREINSIPVGTDLVKPHINSWKGTKVYKSIVTSDYVKVDNVRLAHLWNGKANYETPFGMGH